MGMQNLNWFADDVLKDVKCVAYYVRQKYGKNPYVFQSEFTKLWTSLCQAQWGQPIIVREYAKKTQGNDHITIKTVFQRAERASSQNYGREAPPNDPRLKPNWERLNAFIETGEYPEKPKDLEKIASNDRGWDPDFQF